MRVLACGTGNSAHIIAGLLSAKSDIEVRILSQNQNKVRQWQKISADTPLRVVDRNDQVILVQKSRLLITDDPSLAANGCDVVILSIPAVAHLQYLKILAPYLKKGCMIIGLPGQSGFEFDVRLALENHVRDYTIINFETLPWICRIVDFAKTVRLSGVKSKLIGAMQKSCSLFQELEPLTCLQNLFGDPPTLSIKGHLLGITLLSPSIYVHPPIVYSRWKDWDGFPVEDPPLLYQDIDQDTADLLEKVNQEAVLLGQWIAEMFPHQLFLNAIPFYESLITYYGNEIEDKTNLLTAIRTNPGYFGIRHPMIPAKSGGYYPDFHSRLLTEDVPFGLVVIRGLAEIACLPTPYMDEVIRWSQEKMGQEYLVDSKLIGKDLISTRCPQRYGFTTFTEILGLD